MAVPDLPVADSAPVPPAEDVDAGMEAEYARKHEAMKRFRQESIVVVNNIPKIGENLYEKLVSRLTPIFEKAGPLRPGTSVRFPRSPEGGSLGCALVEYINPDVAFKAKNVLDGKKLDAKHTFWARISTDFTDIHNFSKEYVPPAALPTHNKDQPNYKSWLLDSRGRDMFLVRHNDLTSVFWNDHVIKPSLDTQRPRWTEAHVQWTSKGTYMATIHPRGVKLWGRVGGDKVEWEVVRRFEHHGVSRIDFSPCENYLVSFNATPPDRDDKRAPRSVAVWDIKTGQRKRGFLGPPHSMVGPNGEIPWPLFQWSHDDKYLARRNEDSISVYSTPGMGLLDKKSFKIPKVLDFRWSPSENILAYWVPENENSPARVTLIDIPSRKELRQKALYSVSGIRLHWHPQGTFLCCEVERMTKSKKGRFINFELFRVKAKDIPVEVLEYKEKDLVSYFAWEPHGFRFGLIHGYRDDPSRTDVSMYSMEGAAGELKQLASFEKKACNQLRWSPKGRFVVFASVATQQGALEFYDANDFDMKAEAEPIGQSEHFLCNELYWDPSGRFLASIVSFWRNRSDNGYKIWSMYGKELGRGEFDMLYQFIWRPRPSSLLSAKEEKEVRKNLKVRRERYEKEDKELRDTVSSGKAMQRRKLREAYDEFKAKAQLRIAEESSKRKEALSAKAEEDEVETIEEIITEVISVEEVIDYDKKLLSAEDERD